MTKKYLELNFIVEYSNIKGEGMEAKYNWLKSRLPKEIKNKVLKSSVKKFELVKSSKLEKNELNNLHTRKNKCSDKVWEFA